MIKKSFLTVFLCALLGILAFRSVAQDAGTYEGKYRFSYPSGYTVTEGNDFIQLTAADTTLNVYGPTSYSRILGTQTFDDNDKALQFFVSRSGLKAGDAITEGLAENQLAAVEVTLSQRKQAGRAVLFDLKNGRKAVVVALGAEKSSLDTAALDAVLGSLEYPSDLVDVASSNPDFSTLVAAVQAAGLADTLRDGEYTIFAPTNAAFDKALKQVGMSAADLLTNPDLLTQILQYHVLEGTVTSDTLASGWVTTLSGDQVQVKLDRGQVRINNAHVVTADVKAANGVIHVIDKVLLPPDVEAGRLLKQFTATLKRFTAYEGNFTFKYPTGADVVEGPGNVIVKSGRADVTVYGPDAFNKLLGSNKIEGDAERLAFFLDRLNAYEVGDAIDPLPETAKAGVNVTVTRFNQAGKAYLVDLQNGRTGVVIALAKRDGYSLAYSDFAASQALSTLAYPADLVDVASSKPELSTLVAAINAAGLADTLRDKSASYTIFAPTNDAFAAALASMNMTPADVLGNADLLKDILTYHVIAGAVKSTDLVAGPVETVNTYPATISLTDGAMINDAKVVEADVEAANGVIHVIDKVLVPPLCFASTETKDISVRVGPGENRTRVTFFPLEVKVPVTGQFTDAAGAVWYQVVKEVAAPGKQIKEAWVLSTDVTAAGSGCATVPTMEQAK